MTTFDATTTFRLPDGTTHRVQRDPDPSIRGETSNASWDQIAQAINPNTDGWAIRTAHAMHAQAQPRPHATILFGSRVRGNHREDLTYTSDLDLIVITDAADDDTHGEKCQNALQAAAADLAQRTYGRTIGVDLLAYTPAQFQDFEQYRNNALTEAMLHGVMISADPKRWASRYAGPHPTLPKYQWQAYRLHLSKSKLALDMLITAHTGEQRGNDPMTRYLVSNMLMDREPKARQALAQRYIRSYAPEAIRQSLYSAISATGALPKISATTAQLHQTLSDIAPEEDCALLIHPDVYDTLEHTEHADHDDVADNTQHDVKKLRKLAQKLQRRAKRATDS